MTEDALTQNASPMESRIQPNYSIILESYKLKQKHILSSFAIGDCFSEGGEALERRIQWATP